MTARLAELPLFAPREPRGQTYDRARDEKRLGKQAQAVFSFMRSGAWVTLRDIAAATGAPEASCSARLRDLRASGYTVARLAPVEGGTWRYRLVQR